MHSYLPHLLELIMHVKTSVQTLKRVLQTFGSDSEGGPADLRL